MMNKIFSTLRKLAFLGAIFTLFFSCMTFAQENNDIPERPTMKWVGGGLLTKDAFNYFDEQARQGNASAALSLVSYYRFILQDIEKEAQYLEMAAIAGDANAQFLYATYLSDGVGHQAIYDIDKAKYWAQKAFENGNKDAAVLLSQLTPP